MKSAVAAVALAWAGACAAPGANAAHTTPTPSGANDPVARLERASEDQSARIVELETRLALLEAEARQWRAEAEVPQKPVETVRIGVAQRERVQRPPEVVPLVRLHEDEDEGDPPRASQDAPLSLPAAPAFVSTRLPVVPLPELRSGKTAGAGLPRMPLDDATLRERYREALRALRERRYADARDGLTALLDVQPEHPLADGAVYWLGEVNYAERRYGEALRQFETLLALHAKSSKRPDAMLKAGLCHQRLGDDAAAKRYFQQVRQEYPSSEAARIASREGAS